MGSCAESTFKSSVSSTLTYYEVIAVFGSMMQAKCQKYVATREPAKIPDCWLGNGDSGRSNVKCWCDSDHTIVPSQLALFALEKQEIRTRCQTRLPNRTSHCKRRIEGKLDSPVSYNDRDGFSRGPVTIQSWIWWYIKEYYVENWMRQIAKIYPLARLQRNRWWILWY